jgi:hypothetical protein
MSDAKRGVLLGVLAAGVAVLVVGCSTSAPKVTSEAGGEEQAVTCSKCQTVWVQRAHRMGKNAVVYRREMQMVCPDCQSAIVTFFKTGKLEHTCKSCGGTLDHCTVHQEDVAPAATNAPVAKVEREQAAMCAKCQMVWVRRSHNVGKATVYRREQAMRCPDCKSAVANFFTTGKWQHTCTTCGENLAECAVCR